MVSTSDLRYRCSVTISGEPWKIALPKMFASRAKVKVSNMGKGSRFTVKGLGFRRFRCRA